MQRKLETFLKAHAQDSEIQILIQELRAQQGADERNGLNPPAWMDSPEEARLRYLRGLRAMVDRADSKCPPLKTLQGRSGKKDSQAGTAREIFPDVPVAFERWRRRKKSLYVLVGKRGLRNKIYFAPRVR